jgi:DNA-binding SARP family transcriptional activator
MGLILLFSNMSDNIRKVAFSVLLFSCFLNIHANNAGQGLYFYSYEADKDKRTGLNLTPKKPFGFPKGFTLEFAIKIQPVSEKFGCIFRIIGNESLNVDLFSNVSTLQNFSLIIGKQTFATFTTDEINGFGVDQWMNVSLRCDLLKNRIILKFNDTEKIVDYSFREIDRFHIFFGKNTSEEFPTTDIPPMIIKNVRLYNHKGNLVRNWQMLHHGDDFVLDECKKDKALVSNPSWEIDSHLHWKKIRTFTLPEGYVQVAYDRILNRIFLVKGKNVLIFHPENGSVDSMAVLNGEPFNTDANQLVYDHKNDRLVSYNFETSRLAVFDFQTRNWTNSDNTSISTHYWHHNKYYHPEDSLLFTLGGYGFHRYTSLLQTDKTGEDRWEQTDLSPSVLPRYLAATGIWEYPHLLLFGGYGNESGFQHESPHNYYDLYSINLETLEVSKLWDMEQVKKNFTNSNSLVVNKKDSSFYTLSYPNNVYESYLLLHEYSMKKPGYRVLGDSIRYLFKDIESYCDLFQPEDQSQLIAITTLLHQDQIQKRTEVNIYAINYPPLSVSEVIQIPVTPAIHWEYFLLASGLLLLSIFLFFFVKRKYRKHGQVNPEHSKRIFLPFFKTDTAVEDVPIAPSICLLGNFQIIDNNGKDISNNITFTSRQIFLMILLATIKNKRGISSVEFRNLMWPDKDEESARNNRNVYLNKLRLLIKNMGNLKIDKGDGYWRISGIEDIFCDYGKTISLISLAKERREMDTVLLSEILDLAGKGNLLPFHETEWLDDYKTNYSDLIIEFLLEISARPELKNELVLLLRISEVILLQDSIEESGICLKCKTLFRMGKKKQALEVYRKFAEEHLHLLGIKTGLSFEDIVG